MILAIDASTPVAGVAFYESTGLLYEVYMNAGKNHSETLMPCIDQGLKNCNRKLSDLKAIAVSIGPGSFTGLRIGLAAAKGLGIVLNVPLITVSTLEMLAHNVSGLTNAPVVPMLNARKQEIYTCMYDCSGTYPRALQAEQAVAPERWMEILRQQEQLWLLGDGVKVYDELWESQLGKRVVSVPEQIFWPRAGRLAHLAWHKFESGQYLIDYSGLKPVYLRLSEAEVRLGKGEL